MWNRGKSVKSVYNPIILQLYGAVNHYLSKESRKRLLCVNQISDMGMGMGGVVRNKSKDQARVEFPCRQ